MLLDSMHMIFCEIFKETMAEKNIFQKCIKYFIKVNILQWAGTCVERSENRTLYIIVMMFSGRNT